VSEAYGRRARVRVGGDRGLEVRARTLGAAIRRSNPLAGALALVGIDREQDLGRVDEVPCADVGFRREVGERDRRRERACRISEARRETGERRRGRDALRVRLEGRAEPLHGAPEEIGLARLEGVRLHHEAEA
jgi:hypothetical protein